ncbi:B3 domain-containing protein REM14-like isoform X2 [Solanum tuberosum]|uniref:B3 domain-containing protein REM14-like isoform X2 n=1 Tax=Solanum tuberosum TaxID=4113 RepID=UPI000739F8A5|nr:PREDICTED: B3 domain-containing protein REM14-like isoform X2 [Solanum tuberosum]
MKVTSVKPHFFKPLLPGFKNSLFYVVLQKIPDGFLKYLEGCEEKGHAILKKGGKKWVVKLNGQKLDEGWGQFTEEHDLKLGDMLIFRHEGDLEFGVSVFNLSHCDREYAEYLQEEEEEEEEVVRTIEKTSKNVEFKGATHTPFGQSQFICTVKPYCLRNGYLRVPCKFAKANGLTNKECGLIIRDERQRSWNLRIYTSCSQVYIGGRWSEFRAANDIKKGDQIMFEVVTNGEQPIWNFHEYAKNLQQEETEAHTFEETCKKFESEEAAPHDPSGQSQFVCTVKQYFLTNGYLRIPSKFAKENGLTNKNCGLIIRDERQRSWNLRIYTSCSLVCVGGRWGQFCAANDIKAGDQIMFEVVTNGKQPIWKFHELTNPSTVEEPSENSEFKEAAPHNPIGQSHFECFVRPYCISKGYLRLPKQFAIANGLINKKCGLIIRDEREISWNLRLYTHNSIVHILGGWSEFCVANELKEGDYMMFEVVVNGEKPIWKFHDKPTPSIMSSRKAFPHVEAASDKPSDHSRFVCTIKPYCLTYGYLCLPKQFALRNGLIRKKCDVIITDERQRSWNLILRPFGTSVCIRGGWDKFHEAYCLKEGDRIMFEVVTDGEKPLWKFHGGSYKVKRASRCTKHPTLAGVR